MVRRHGPILRTVGAATLCFLALAALQLDELHLVLAPVAAIGFIAGLLYTNLFEYWVHRYPMHRGLPLLRHVRRNHIEHHRIFHGSNFRTTHPEDLAHISGRFWIFPVLLAAHFALLEALLPAGAAMAFLFASYLHYLTFEISHWLTHLEDNAVDRALSRIPWLSAIRARQIEHHRLHHETPIADFNFSPPYLGDAFLGPKAVPGRKRDRSAIPVRPRSKPRPAFAYAAALALAAVALGIAAFHQTRSSTGAPAPRTRS